MKRTIDGPRQFNSSRRTLMSRLIGFAALAVPVGLPRRSRGAKTSGGQNADRSAFMRAANDMREQAVRAGDQAYGAVIVRGSEIVGRGPSRVVTRGDPTAHAEIEAIRDACQQLDTNDLTGCTMYGTSPPCAMCETAAYWARLDEVRFGTEGTSGHAPRYGAC